MRRSMMMAVVTAVSVAAAAQAADLTADKIVAKANDASY